MALAFAFAFSPAKKMITPTKSTALAMLAATLVLVAAVAAAAPLAATVAPLASATAKLAPAWLTTQPVLFLLLNTMIFAVLAPSGLFSDPDEPPLSTSQEEEPPPLPSASESPPPPSTPAPMDSTAVKLEQQEMKKPEQEQQQQLGQEQEEQAQQVLPKVRVKRVRRSVSSTSAPSRVLKRNPHQRSASVSSSIVAPAPSSPRVISMVVDESNRENIPPSWGANGSSTATAAMGCSTLKDDDFKDLIDSFIARARHQMVLQEQMEMAAERAARRRR